MEKTNVMRLLDQKKIKYLSYHYPCEVAISAKEVAEKLNLNPKKVFKTLVTRSKDNKNYVFMLPALKELDLKKAANVSNEKAIEMVKSKELLPLCGYIHGGCSPIGMKKAYMTFIDKSCLDFDTIIFSAGKIGYQVEMNWEELSKFVTIKVVDIAQ